MRAVDAVLKEFSIETLDEVNRTTQDEYVLKAGDILSSLEKYVTLLN